MACVVLNTLPEGVRRWREQAFLGGNRSTRSLGTCLKRYSIPRGSERRKLREDPEAQGAKTSVCFPTAGGA